MNNPKQILGTDQNSIPPKNYLGQKEDGIYECINGNGIKTKAFASGSEEQDCGLLNFEDAIDLIIEQNIDIKEEYSGESFPREQLVYPDKYFYITSEDTLEEIDSVSDLIKALCNKNITVNCAYNVEPTDGTKLYIGPNFGFVELTQAGIEVQESQLNDNETIYFFYNLNTSGPK